MGIFTELVLSFELRPDIPSEVLAAVSSLCPDPEADGLPDPPNLQIRHYDPWDEPPRDPPWQYDWGPFLGADESSVFGGDCGATLERKPRGSWTLTTRAVHKHYPDELVPAVLWMAPFACPTAEDGFHELAGYLYSRQACDRPILIWHDGHRFVLEDLNPDPGSYR